MHAPTATIYDGIARAWRASRGEARDELGRRFREEVGEGLVADLGCGPGRYLGQLGSPVLAVDVSRSMLSLALSLAGTGTRGHRRTWSRSPSPKVRLLGLLRGTPTSTCPKRGSPRRLRS